MNKMLSKQFLGNSIEEYLILVGAIILGLIFKKLISEISKPLIV